MDSQSLKTDVHHAFVENPDGTKVAVLGNSGEARSITLQISGMGTELTLQRNAIATLVWR